MGPNNRFYWFTIAALSHFVPDFIFQGEIIAQSKKRFNKYMLAHVAILTLMVSPAFYFYFGGLKPSFFLATSIWGSSHLVIDVMKVEMTEKAKKFFWQILGIDQLFHILILFLIFWLLP